MNMSGGHIGTQYLENVDLWVGNNAFIIRHCCLFCFFPLAGQLMFIVSQGMLSVALKISESKHNC